MRNTTQHSTFSVTVTNFYDPFGDGKSNRKPLETRVFLVIADRNEIINLLNDMNNNIRSYYNQFHFSVSKNETSRKGRAIQIDQLLSKI